MTGRARLGLAALAGIASALLPAGAAARWSSPRVIVGDSAAHSPRIAAVPGRQTALSWRGRADAIYVATGRRGLTDRRARVVAGSRRAGSHAVAINASGDLVVAWQRNDLSIPPDEELREDTYCCNRIWAATARAGGRFSRPRLLSRKGPATLPAVAIDESGRAVVAWRDPSGVALATARAGHRLGAAQDVERDSFGSGPSLAVSPEGALNMMWSRDAGTDEDAVDAQVMRLVGTAGGGIMSVTPILEDRSFYGAAIVAGPSGQTLVGWNSRGPLGPRQSNTATAAYGAGGDTPERAVIASFNGFGGYFGELSGAMNAQGAALLACPQGNDRVGDVLWIASRAPTGSLRVQSYPVRSHWDTHPRASVDPEGRTLVVWGSAGARGRVRFISAAGTAGGLAGRRTRLPGTFPRYSSPPAMSFVAPDRALAVWRANRRLVASTWVGGE